MLSAAYRQASHPRADADEDRSGQPAALAHESAPPRRRGLPRLHACKATGSARRHGWTARPRTWTSRQHRRTVYGRVSRGRSSETLLQLYDFPDPDACTVPSARLTTTPLQQLFVMNSAFMQEQAAALAGERAKEPDASGESSRPVPPGAGARSRRAEELATRRRVTCGKATLARLRPGAAVHQRGDLLAMNQTAFRAATMLQSLCGGLGIARPRRACCRRRRAGGEPPRHAGPHFRRKAKHIIFLFMTGGPSQVDMFDPKPALDEVCRPAARLRRTCAPSAPPAACCPSPFEFTKHGERHRGQRAAAQPRRRRRRSVRHPLDVHVQPDAQAGAQPVPLRQHRCHAPVDGLVDLLRPGHREPEPAGLRRACARRRRRVHACAAASCPRSTRARRSTIRVTEPGQDDPLPAQPAAASRRRSARQLDLAPGS